MIRHILALLPVFTLFSCDTSKNETSNLYDLVPEKSSYIIDSENISSFLNEIDRNTVLNNSDIFKNFDLQGVKESTSLFTPTNSLLYFIKKDSLYYNYVYLSKAKNDSLINSSSADFSVETITAKDFSYKKTVIGKSTFYSTKSNEVLIASNSLKLLEETANREQSEINKSENFKKAIAARSIGKSSLFIHHKASNHLIADWSVVDLEINNHTFSFNGIAITKNQSNQLLGIFQGVRHQKNELAKITPTSANGFYSFTYNDFSTLSKNLQDYRSDSSKVVKNTILSYTKEAGVILMGDATAIALTLVDPKLAMDDFPVKDELKTEFRGIPIYSTSEIDYVRSFKPLITAGSPKYYMLLEDFLVYSEKQETLKRIISSFQNNLTLDKNATFEKIQENLAEASSLLIVTRPQLSKAQIEKSLLLNKISPFGKLGKNYTLAATQFVSNDGFAHIHGIVLDDSDIKSEDNKELITTTLPIKVSGKTFILKNHHTKELEIAVQDEGNVLSLLDLDGKVLWKKKLPTKIIGKITQVDLFKNGNLQLAFTTLNKFHVLDRNGKEVKPFPLGFKDQITQPVAIFDYDNNRNFRFVIVQKNEVLMYDFKGKAVKGFDFNKASSEILTSPKHIRIKNKDYIVFPERSGKLNILSRQGKERIPVKEKFQFSENDWYENKNEFVSVSEDEKLIRVHQNGKISAKQYTTDGNLQIAANENTLVLLSENILTINSKEIPLDFGLYSSPKIFSVSGKNHISLADTQANKVYLFNEKGELAPNFPVYGNSLIGITNSKTRSKSFMLVLGESNEIISYEF